MAQKLSFSDIRLAETSAQARGSGDDRLPLGTAITLIAGASAVLWSLIALAIGSVI
ncbi:MAG: hypothetical protein AB7H90_06775 [Alphaproteobacteria bacterium]